MLEPAVTSMLLVFTYSAFLAAQSLQLRWANGPGERKSFTLESKEMYGNHKSYKEAIGREEEISFVSIK
jgi:hypothetical protein